ncbi:MAG: hypothetical protein JRD93_06060 [Deltaproteobacteria bacterium]|nr:hypothetical protein [Deltaproteobacteria bacterium]
MLLSYFGHRNSTVSFIRKKHFFKYYSIAFSILSGIAGGLAQELLKDCPNLFLELQIYGVGRWGKIKGVAMILATRQST